MDHIFLDRIVEQYLHTFANLTLTGYNSDTATGPTLTSGADILIQRGTVRPTKKSR